MKVYIKEFNVDMEVKTNGIEFEVRDNADNFLGDVFLTKTGLIWCAGRTQRANGKSIRWEKFVQWASEQ